MHPLISISGCLSVGLLVHWMVGWSVMLGCNDSFGRHRRDQEVQRVDPFVSLSAYWLVGLLADRLIG